MDCDIYSNNPVSIHGHQASKGGELTHDETTIINGALDSTEKSCLKYFIFLCLHVTHKDANTTTHILTIEVVSCAHFLETMFTAILYGSSMSLLSDKGGDWRSRLPWKVSIYWKWVPYLIKLFSGTSYLEDARAGMSNDFYSSDDVNGNKVIENYVAYHGEANRGIHEFLQGVPIKEEMKNASKESTQNQNHPATTTTTTTPMTDDQLKVLISQGVADVLVKREATRSRNGKDNHDLGPGDRRTERVAREYTYPDFMKCQPLNFKGTEGVVELTQWFERMEIVFRIRRSTHLLNVRLKTRGNLITRTKLNNNLPRQHGVAMLINVGSGGRRSTLGLFHCATSASFTTMAHVLQSARTARKSAI
ncbi:hypothetical protein Tco_0595644 [Tanacetum coccineum]